MRRCDHPAIEAFEQALAVAPERGPALYLQHDWARRQHAALGPLADALVLALARWMAGAVGTVTV